MPLQPGSSQNSIKANIRRSRQEGKTLQQSIVIALQKAGKATKKKRDTKSKKALINALGKKR